jgi:hypothetical protein
MSMSMRTYSMPATCEQGGVEGGSSISSSLSLFKVHIFVHIKKNVNLTVLYI